MKMETSVGNFLKEKSEGMERVSICVRAGPPVLSSATMQQPGSPKGQIKIGSYPQLDALVAEHVTGDEPAVAWADSFGLFRFHSRAEAEEAITNSYYRLFRPDLDWEQATVCEVRTFPAYSTDLPAAWSIIERLGTRSEIRRQGNVWRAAFAGAEAFADTPALAICLAALRSRGIDPVFCDALLDEEGEGAGDAEEDSAEMESAGQAKSEYR